MSSDERRKSERRQADLILELYEPDGKLIVGVGRLVNLSLHGAYFHTTLRLTHGQGIHLLLRLDEKLLLEIPSRVVWSGIKQQVISYGVEFMSLSPDAKEKLRTWSSSHSSLFKKGN